MGAYEDHEDDSIIEGLSQEIEAAEREAQVRLIQRSIEAVGRGKPNILAITIARLADENEKLRAENERLRAQVSPAKCPVCDGTGRAKSNGLVCMRC